MQPPFESCCWSYKIFSMRKVKHYRYCETSGIAVLFFLALICSCSFVKVNISDFGTELEPAPGWDEREIEKISEYLSTTEFDAFVAMAGEKLIMEWGVSDELINCASVRKSIVSVLYGIAASKGLIDLDAPLSDSGIDDAKAPLTDIEKQATVRDLLKSRSGIYIRSQGENKGMEERRPERGDHRPGEHFYYNNWGFNVLGTIFEQETGIRLGDAIYNWLAKPTGMKHFHPSHVIYSNADYTEHRMYRIYMSAEDLARIGVLMVQGGRWGNKQVVPEKWVQESTQPWSKVDYSDRYEAYGYLWWLDLSEGTIWADGSGGQFLLIDPEHDLVLSARNRTGNDPMGVFLYSLFGKDASPQDLIKIHHMLLDSRR